MSRRPRDLDPTASPLALFGSELRRYRELAGLSQDQLGKKVHVTGSFIGAVERAECRCDRRLAVESDKVPDTRGALVSLWDALVLPSVYPSWFDWPRHERAATVLRAFQFSVVYGLLQTEAYARALLGPDEAAVQARLARQEILSKDKAPLVVCVLDEGVLHRKVGSPEIMREQLEHLISVASDRIRIQVVPDEWHPGVLGSFVISTPDRGAEVAYVQTVSRGLTIAEPKEIGKLNEIFEQVRSYALPVGQSLDLIRKTVKTRWT